MASLIIGGCDCCDASDVVLHFRIAYGIETYACAECCGLDPEDDAAEVATADLPAWCAEP